MKRRAILMTLAAIALPVAPVTSVASSAAAADPLAVTVTGAPPAGTVLVADAARTIVPVTITGTAPSSSAVELAAETGTGSLVSLCSTVAAPDGTWSCTFSSAPDLPGPVMVAATGAADPVAVDVSVLGTPVIATDAPGALTATATPDDPSQPVSGTGAPGAVVAVTISDWAGGTGGCTATVDPAGAWTCTVAALPAGAAPYAITAEQAYPWAPVFSVDATPVSYDYAGPGAVGPGVGSGSGDPEPGGSGGGSSSGGGGGSGGGGSGAGGGTAGGGTGTGTPGAGTSGGSYGMPADGTVGSDAGLIGADGGSSDGGGAGEGSDSWDIAPSDGSGAGGSFSSSASSAAGIRAGAAHALAGEERISAGGLAAGSGRNDLFRREGSRSADGRSVGGASGGVLGEGGVASGRSDLRGAARGAGGPGGTAFSGSLRTVGDVAGIGAPGMMHLGVLVAGLLLMVMMPGGILESTVHENWGRIRRAWPFTWFSALHERRAARLGAGSGARGASSWAWAAVTIGVAVAASVVVSPSASALDGAGMLALLVPFAIAMIVANGLPMAATSGYAWVRLRRRARLLVRPASLVLTAATVVASRLAGVEPGFVFGAVVGVAFGAALGRASGARTVVVGTSAALALGLGAWLAASALRAQPGSGAGDSLVLDTLTAVTVCALSGPVVSLLPLRFLDGRRLFEASRAGWAALYAAAAVVFGVVLLPLPDAWSAVGGDLLWWCVCLGVASAATAMVWAYFRWMPDRCPARAPLDAVATTEATTAPTLTARSDGDRDARHLD
jgi:hypothetical protein